MPADISEEYLSWLNDEYLMRYSSQRFIKHTIDTSINYLTQMNLAGNLFLGITRLSDKVLVGTMTAQFNNLHKTANLGILVGRPDARGTGIALEAWNALSSHLLEELNLRKLCAGTLASNMPMNSLARKSGMELEGVLIAQELVDGIPIDVNLYGKMKAAK